VNALQTMLIALENPCMFGHEIVRMNEVDRLYTRDVIANKLEEVFVQLEITIS
jgi:hypothetical protein